MNKMRLASGPDQPPTVYNQLNSEVISTVAAHRLKPSRTDGFITFASNFYSASKLNIDIFMYFTGFAGL